MNIRVLFFASLRDISGVSEQQLDVQAGTSIASLWQQISAGFELLPEKVLCAVNQGRFGVDALNAKRQALETALDGLEALTSAPGPTVT